MEKSELTLWDLCLKAFKGIGRMLKWCVDVFLRSLQLCYRKWWITVPVVIACFAVAMYLSRPTNRWFHANAIAILNGPTVELTEQVLSPLTHPLDPRYNAYQTNYSVLHLGSWVADSNDNLSTFPVIDVLADSTYDFVDFKGKVRQDDTLRVRMPNRLALRFDSRDINTVPEYTDSLLSFLNHNPLMIAAYDAYKANLERKALFCETQIERLDSFTYEFYFKQFASNPQLEYNRYEFLIGKRQVYLLHDEILELFARKEYIDNQLCTCTAPVVLESGFVLDRKAQNGRVKTCLIGILVGYLLSCLIAAFIENCKPLFRWLGERPDKKS